MNRDENLIGAAVLLLADRIREAVEEAAGRIGSGPAALTALLNWADGATIDQLARGLGVSHSRGVRIVDELEAEGLARRDADAEDRRRVLVALTRRGRNAAEGILRAREAAISDSLASLSAADRSALGRLAESIIRDRVEDRDGARVVCRFCDTEACGFDTGRCPATQAADAAESGE